MKFAPNCAGFLINSDLLSSMTPSSTVQFALQHFLDSLLREGLCVYAELWSREALVASRGDPTNAAEPEVVQQVPLGGKPYTVLARRDDNPFLPPLDVAAVRRCAEACQEATSPQDAKTPPSDTLARTLDFVTDAFVLVGHGWEILHCNLAFERLSGFPDSALLGQSLWTRCGVLKLPAIRTQLQSALANGQASEIECWNSDSDRWLYVRIFPCTEGLSVFVQDITARKKVEETKLDLERQLSQGRRMESLGTLAAGIAHDFNNVLSAVIGHAGMLREKLDAHHAARLHADEIWVAASRARDLTGRILAYSRSSRGETDKQPLKALTRESVNLLKATLPTTVRLNAQLDGQEVCARILPSEVQQIVVNLCTNAWQAMPNGKGHLHVNVSHVDVPQEMPVDTGVLRPGAYVMLTVEDDGTGMSPDVRAHLFEPFFTTKARGEGTGLGLYVVSGIASAREGGIRVTAAEGKGARFDVFIPACDDEHSDPTISSLSTHKGHSERVAYIDDDPVVCVMVEQLLNTRGFVTTTFADPESALQALLTQHFDIVVTDQNMPDFSGVEVANILRTRGVDLPIVLSTGLISEELRKTAKDAGICEVFPKERSFEDLPTLLIECLARSPRAGAAS